MADNQTPVRSSIERISGPPRSGARRPAGDLQSSISRSATSLTSIGWNLMPDGTGTTGLRDTVRTSTPIRLWNCVARWIVQGNPELMTRASAPSFSW